jgi:hypothetical protein
MRRSWPGPMPIVVATLKFSSIKYSAARNRRAPQLARGYEADSGHRNRRFDNACRCRIHPVHLRSKHREAPSERALFDAGGRPA